MTKKKNFSPEQKVTIIRKQLLEKVPVSDLCDQYGFHPSVFYRWQKIFFEKGSKQGGQSVLNNLLV